MLSDRAAKPINLALLTCAAAVAFSDKSEAATLRDLANASSATNGNNIEVVIPNYASPTATNQYPRVASFAVQPGNGEFLNKISSVVAFRDGDANVIDGNPSQLGGLKVMVWAAPVSETVEANVFNPSHSGWKGVFSMETNLTAMGNQITGDKARLHDIDVSSINIKLDSGTNWAIGVFPISTNDTPNVYTLQTIARSNVPNAPTNDFAIEEGVPTIRKLSQIVGAGFSGLAWTITTTNAPTTEPNTRAQISAAPGGIQVSANDLTPGNDYKVEVNHDLGTPNWTMAAQVPHSLTNYSFSPNTTGSVPGFFRVKKNNPWGR